MLGGGALIKEGPTINKNNSNTNTNNDSTYSSGAL